MRLGTTILLGATTAGVAHSLVLTSPVRLVTPIQPFKLSFAPLSCLGVVKGRMELRLCMSSDH